MRRKLTLSCLIFAWLCANGAVWDAMQVAAWGKMFADYSGKMTITQALRETFDASKPCEMCVGIAKAKDAAEQNQSAPQENAAAKVFLAIHLVAEPVFENDRGDWLRVAVTNVSDRIDPVPVPPPRV